MTLHSSTPVREPILIERPNELKARIGGSLDPVLITQADAAIASMAGDFQQWLEETVGKLVGARQALGSVSITAASRGTLYTCALETKSLGETYGYPLISRFAQSLCKLLIRLADDRAAPAALVDAHIDAIRAALRSRMTAANDPVGVKLATELETQVAGFFR